MSMTSAGSQFEVPVKEDDEAAAPARLDMLLQELSLLGRTASASCVDRLTTNANS
jgi:hypothetical protein